MFLYRFHQASLWYILAHFPKLGLAFGPSSQVVRNSSDVAWAGGPAFAFFTSLYR
jgi:hypothetical protein